MALVGTDIKPHTQFDFRQMVQAYDNRFIDQIKSVFQSKNANPANGGLQKVCGINNLIYKTDDKQYIGIERLYADDATGTKYLIVNDSTSIDIWKTGTDVTSMVSALTATTEKWNACTYNGIAYIFNKNNYTARKIDLATMGTSTLSNCPAEPCRKAVVFQQRLYAISSISNKVFVSDPITGGDPVFQTSSYFRCPDELSTKELKNICLHLGKIVIFTEDTYTIYYGTPPDDPIAYTYYLKDDLLQAPYSLVDIDGVKFGLGMKRVWVFNGAGVYEISQEIQPIIDDINKTYIKNAVGGKRNNEYWLAYTSTSGAGTKNDKYIVYDTQSKTWSGPHTYSIKDMAIADRCGDDNRIYFVNDETVCHDDTPLINYTDDSIYKRYSCISAYGGGGAQAIDMDVYTSWLDNGNPFLRKLARWLTVQSAIQTVTSSITLQYAIDFSSSWSDLTTVSQLASGNTYGDKDTVIKTDRTMITYPIKIPGNVIYNVIRFRLRQNTINAPCHIYGINFEAEAVN